MNQSLTSNTSSSLVSVYGCGGTGISIVNNWAEATPNSKAASATPYYLDTSYSNVRRRHIKEEATYIISGLDGSGGRRDENYPTIDRNIPSMLERLPPSTFNIIVFSGGGGSGSVIGPLLLAAIKEQGKHAVVLMVGSHESERRCTNTLNTLATLNSIGKRNKFCPVIAYDSNGDQTISTEVDTNMYCCIDAILRLASGNYDRLDSKDVLNFFDPAHTVNLAPELLLLDIVTTPDGISDIEYPVAVAALAEDNGDFKSIPAEYNCEGFFVNNDKPELPLYFAIHNSGRDNIISELKEKETDFKRRRSNRDRASGLDLDNLGAGDDNGMVL